MTTTIQSPRQIEALRDAQRVRSPAGTRFLQLMNEVPATAAIPSLALGPRKDQGAGHQLLAAVEKSQKQLQATNMRAMRTVSLDTGPLLARQLQTYNYQVLQATRALGKASAAFNDLAKAT